MAAFCRPVRSAALLEICTGLVAKPAMEYIVAVVEISFMKTKGMLLKFCPVPQTPSIARLTIEGLLIPCG